MSLHVTRPSGDRPSCHHCQVPSGKSRKKGTEHWERGREKHPGRTLSILLPLPTCREKDWASWVCCLQPNGTCQTFGEGFKLSNYFSFKNAQKSHLETILSCTELKYSSGQKQKFFWAPPVTHRSSFVEVFFHGQEFCSEHQTIRLTESEDQFDKLKKLESRSLQQCDNT